MTLYCRTKTDNFRFGPHMGPLGDHMGPLGHGIGTVPLKFWPSICICIVSYGHTDKHPYGFLGPWLAKHVCQIRLNVNVMLTVLVLVLYNVMLTLRQWMLSLLTIHCQRDQFQLAPAWPRTQPDSVGWQEVSAWVVAHILSSSPILTFCPPLH